MDTDITKTAISADIIRSFFEPGTPVFDFEIHDEIDSTNKRLKSLAAGKAYERTVVVSASQTAGRGRLGRSFFSPEGGVYFSLLLRPKMPISNAVFITSAAASAMACTLDAIFGCNSGIKWVNDIYVDGKKVCGILAEGTFDADGKLSSAVLGVGVNITAPAEGFPEDISNKAGAMLKYGEEIAFARERVIAGFLSRFWEYYKAFPLKKFLNEYTGRSILTGMSVQLLNASDEAYTATVTGINERCELEVELEDGTRKAISSGDAGMISYA